MLYKELPEIENMITIKDNDIEGKVFIIHTNDSHGHYSDNLGFSKVAAVKDWYKSRGATVFLMDAGDAFQGTSITMISHGSTTVDIMNEVGYDLMTPGNHDFDYTLERYINYTNKLNFPTISANIIWKKSGTPVFPQYSILKKDGVTLGVFGLTTPDTIGSVKSGYLGDVIIVDPIESSKSMVELLQKMNVDYIVALGHIGINRLSSITSDKICAQVDGIDVFIDGHSHTAMSNGKVVDYKIDLIASDTLIANTGSYIKNIGVVHLGNTCTSQLISNFGQSDPTIDSTIKKIYESQNSTLSQIIGHTETCFCGYKNYSRLMETIIGDLVSDAIRNCTGSDIAVINGGAFRASVFEGDITVKMLYDLISFESYIVTKQIPGKVLWDIMENSVSSLPYASGRFLQVSGITVYYNSKLDIGNRVTDIYIGNLPVNKSSTYTLSSCDYIMDGGDGFDMISSFPVKFQSGPLSEAIIRYLTTFDSNIIKSGRLTDISQLNDI